MAKSKKDRKGKAKRQRPTSRLSDHKRDKGLLKAPMMALPGIHLTVWLPAQFPDMLWLCSLINVHGKKALYIGTRVLDRLQEHLTNNGERPVIDGRLAVWEELPERSRAAVLEALRDNGVYEDFVPEQFAHAIGMYPTAPGRWLAHPWYERGLSVDPVTAERFLSDVIRDCTTGRSQSSTWAKAIAFGGALMAGKLHFTQDIQTVELLRRYPQLDEDDLARAESFIRASFGAFVGMEETKGGESNREAWAKRFWRANWQLYTCRFPDGDQHAGTDDGEELRRASDHFRKLVEECHQRVVEASRLSDPDLFAPDRHEVLSGIAARACRIAHAAASSPVLWSGEHGAAPVRAVVESHILLKWLLQQQDLAVFARFKEYGRGRLKLAKLHLEEYLDSLDEPPDGLQEYVEGLDQLVNEDLMEEFQNIKVSSAFDTDLRKMAKQVGMERDYKLLYQPLSDVAHGEWSSISRYAMERCRNPLHMWHRVPAPLGTYLSTGVLQLLVSTLDELIDTYVDAIAAP